MNEDGFLFDYDMPADETLDEPKSGKEKLFLELKYGPIHYFDTSSDF